MRIFIINEKNHSTVKKYLPFILLVGLSYCSQPKKAPSLDRFEDGIHHWNLEHKDRNYERYTPEQYIEIADNLIAYQNEDGGWPKNIDWLGILNTDSVYSALKESYKRSTLDNRNTFPQIEYLADVYAISGEQRFKDATLKGLDYLFNTQKTNGGWRGWDVDAITFNDDVTTGALELFRNIVQGDESFAWLDAEYKAKIKERLDKGIQMILDCQVVQDGVKTAWGQQHDNETLLPVQARSYEHAGITARESCEILFLLMGIENPSPEIIEAVKNAITWLEKVQIKGMKVERVPLAEDQIINHEYPYDNVVVIDEQAAPIWARYYEVEDNTPFMSTREGQKVWKLEDVNAERRTGYDWYGYWPVDVLKAYPDWLKKVEQ